VERSSWDESGSEAKTTSIRSKGPKNSSRAASVLEVDHLRSRACERERDERVVHIVETSAGSVTGEGK